MKYLLFAAVSNSNTENDNCYLTGELINSNRFLIFTLRKISITGSAVMFIFCFYQFIGIN